MGVHIRIDHDRRGVLGPPATTFLVCHYYGRNIIIGTCHPP